MVIYGICKSHLSSVLTLMLFRNLHYMLVLVLCDALSHIFMIAKSSNMTHLILANLIGVIAPQHFLNYLAFQSFRFEEYLMKVFPKTRCAYLI